GNSGSNGSGFCGRPTLRAVGPRRSRLLRGSRSLLASRGERRQVVAGRVFRAPLGAEQGEVRFQPLAQVAIELLERGVADVMHEDVLGHQQAEAGLTRAQAQVIVLEKAKAVT